MSQAHEKHESGVPDAVDLENGSNDGLRRLRTAQSITMSPELFEKLYLSPPNKVKGDLRRTFANPTPLALIGFLLSLTPLSCDLMGWRGAGELGIASIAAYFFFGGLLMFISGILEWLLGNTFPATVFCSFGAFWFTFGGTLNPSFGAYAIFATDPEKPATGMSNPTFNASLGFYLLAVNMMLLIYLICALRTNVIYVVIFLSLTVAVGMLTAAFWFQADDLAGNASKVRTMFTAAGAFLFVTCMAGWYLLLAILLDTVDFPFSLPVGDLSGVIKGRAAR